MPTERTVRFPRDHLLKVRGGCQVSADKSGRSSREAKMTAYVEGSILTNELPALAASALAVFFTALLKHRVSNPGKKEREKAYFGRPSDAGLRKKGIRSTNEKEGSLSSLHGSEGRGTCRRRCIQFAPVTGQPRTR